ncbi:MAG: hypothetical protein B7Z81_13770, partial [Acidocella sp. 20-61-6]
QDILRNPFYYGNFLYKGELYQGSHKPMISKKLFDKIQQAGGFVSFNAGSAPDANSILIPKKIADLAMIQHGDRDRQSDQNGEHEGADDDRVMVRKRRWGETAIPGRPRPGNVTQHVAPPSNSGAC